MTQSTTKNTGRFSCETVKLMLDLNSMLRSHGIYITITAHDIEQQLIQASERCDDEEIQTLRQRLIDIQAQSDIARPRDEGSSIGSIQLQGSYIDDSQDTRARGIVVEALSLKGLRFRTQSECKMAGGDRLCVQFALDDQPRTLLWQEVLITKVCDQTVWADFAGEGNAARVLRAYLEQCRAVGTS